VSVTSSPARQFAQALHVAHGEKEQIPVLARLVDRDHVRVVERGRDPRLTQETLAEAPVPSEVGRDHLQRDLALQPLLQRAVDRTHPPAADEFLDPVAGHPRSRRQLGARNVSHESTVTAAAKSVQRSFRPCGERREPGDSGQERRPSEQGSQAATRSAQPHQLRDRLLGPHRLCSRAKSARRRARGRGRHLARRSGERALGPGAQSLRRRGDSSRELVRVWMPTPPASSPRSQ
jgi:hypothetical protein